MVVLKFYDKGFVFLFKKFFYLFIFLLPSCGLFYLNGAANIYEKKMYSKANIIDSAFILYYDRFPEYQLNNKIMKRIIDRGGLNSKKRYERYKKIKYYYTKHYTEDTVYVSKYYFLYSKKLKCCYTVSVGDGGHYSLIYLPYLRILEDTILNINRRRLPRVERLKIKQEFDSIIIPRIKGLINEIQNK